MLVNKLFFILSFCAGCKLVASLADNSYVCRPCARSNCYLSDSSKTISVSGFGSLTCGEIQAGADADIYNPQECSFIQQVTLGTSDPCDCKADGGEDCPPPGFTQGQACNLCGEGSDLRIGDPHMIIKSGILRGIECITAFDDNVYGAFSIPAICPIIQGLFKEYCSCIPVGETIKQCIQQEHDLYGCDPNDPTDICCEGFCRYRNSHGKHVCTHKLEELAPPSDSPTPIPAPAPSDAPVPAPVPAPSAAPVPAPSDAPVPAPSAAPFPAPSAAPFPAPSAAPFPAPSAAPVPAPSAAPVPAPSAAPVPAPSAAPIPAFTAAPVPAPGPSDVPSVVPSDFPSGVPSIAPITPAPVPVEVPTIFSSLPGESECDPHIGCGNDSLLICAFVGGAEASYKCISRSATSMGRVSVARGRGGRGGGNR